MKQAAKPRVKIGNNPSRDIILRACKKLNLNYITVLGRIDFGVPPRVALSVPKNCKFIADPKEKKIRDACKKHGLRYDIVNRRIRKGMSLKEAISQSL